MLRRLSAVQFYLKTLLKIRATQRALLKLFAAKTTQYSCFVLFFSLFVCLFFFTDMVKSMVAEFLISSLIGTGIFFPYDHNETAVNFHFLLILVNYYCKLLNESFRQ